MEERHAEQPGKKKMRMNNALFLNYAGFLIICSPPNNLFNKLIKRSFPLFKGGCTLPGLSSIFAFVS